MLGYSVIEPKVCQKVGAERRKSLKIICIIYISVSYISIYHIYMIIWKQLVRECLQHVKEPINEVNKNAISVVRSDCHCKGEVVVLVRQKSP